MSDTRERDVSGLEDQIATTINVKLCKETYTLWEIIHTHIQTLLLPPQWGFSGTVTNCTNHNYIKKNTTIENIQENKNKIK